MKQIAGSLALLLVMGGACLAAPPARRAKAARPKLGVVKRMVRSHQHAHKPVAPVTIQVLPGPVVGPERQQMRVIVTPGINAAHVEVVVAAEAGLGLVEGRQRWTMPARAGTAAAQDVVLAVTGTGERRFLIQATLVSPTGARMTGIAAYVLNPLSERPIPGSREVTAPDGRKFLELPAQAQPSPTRSTPEAAPPARGSEQP